MTTSLLKTPWHASVLNWAFIVAKKWPTKNQKKCPTIHQFHMMNANTTWLIMNPNWKKKRKNLTQPERREQMVNSQTKNTTTHTIKSQQEKKEEKSKNQSPKNLTRNIYQKKTISANRSAPASCQQTFYTTNINPIHSDYRTNWAHNQSPAKTRDNNQQTHSQTHNQKKSPKPTRLCRFFFSDPEARPH